MEVILVLQRQNERNIFNIYINGSISSYMGRHADRGENKKNSEIYRSVIADDFDDPYEQEQVNL